MAESFDIKQFDLYPTFRARLTDVDGNALDLATATQVRLLLKNRTTGLKVNAVMDVLEDTGEVEYSWQLGDTDTLGTFQGEIQVEFPGQKTQTFPGRGYIKVNVNRDLGPTTGPGSAEESS